MQLVRQMQRHVLGDHVGQEPAAPSPCIVCARSSTLHSTSSACPEGTIGAAGATSGGGAAPDMTQKFTQVTTAMLIFLYRSNAWVAAPKAFRSQSAPNT